MKKLSVSVLLVFTLIIFACATQPMLKDHQPRSLDEEKIVKLVLDLQKAYNSYEHIAVLELHTAEAMIKTGMKDDWSGDIVTKKEYAGMVAYKIAKFQKHSFKLKYFLLEEMYVAGNIAKMTIPYEISSTVSNYWEKGIVNFEFRKKDSGWLIRKNTWEVLDSNHPKFKQ